MVNGNGFMEVSRKEAQVSLSRFAPSLATHQDKQNFLGAKCNAVVHLVTLIFDWVICRDIR
jgi:hypothetical protein